LAWSPRSNAATSSTDSFGKNIVAVKESAPDTRRFTDFRNAFGDRYTLFAGLDDVALEGSLIDWTRSCSASRWSSGINQR
jgi:dihydrodipicolinate synthase/N-acetylneuraminate lyase